ncbi:MAG: hypothetical protein H6872_14075 [Methylobacteriaceae bacterium]|nr:hypothetical protein [Methylobacteriaceae bacterium]
MTIPLIAVRMERRANASANGWGVAVSGLATILVSPLHAGSGAQPRVRHLMLWLWRGGRELAGLAFVDNVLWWFPIRFGFGASQTLFFVVSEYAINARWRRRNGAALWIRIHLTRSISACARSCHHRLRRRGGARGLYAAIALFAIGGADHRGSARHPDLQRTRRAPRPGDDLRAPVIMLASLPVRRWRPAAWASCPCTPCATATATRGDWRAVRILRRLRQCRFQSAARPLYGPMDRAAAHRRHRDRRSSSARWRLMVEAITRGLQRCCCSCVGAALSAALHGRGLALSAGCHRRFDLAHTIWLVMLYATA